MADDTTQPLPGPELPDLDGKDPLKAQFVLSLFADRVFAGLHTREERTAAALPLIDALQQRPETWRTNYLCELLQTSIHRPQKQLLEIERRLVDADDLMLQSAPTLRAEFERIRLDVADRAKNTPEQIGTDHAPTFNLLQRVVSDVQWGYVRRALKHDLVQTYRQRVYGVFMLAITLFFLVMFFTLSPDLNTEILALESASGFWLAVVTGVFGAAFSMVAMFNKRVAPAAIDDMEALGELANLALRLGFGAGAAVILYFIFQADLLEGILFPDLEHLGLMPVMVEAPSKAFGSFVPNKDTSALIVWAFIAGFSESFVPSLLSRIERNAGEKT